MVSEEVLRQRLAEDPPDDRAFTLMKIYELRQLVPLDPRATAEIQRRRKRKAAKKAGDLDALRGLAPPIMPGKTVGLQIVVARLFGYAEDEAA